MSVAELLARNSDENFLVRKLEVDDFTKGYPELLNQFATVGSLTRQTWDAQFTRIQANPKHYVIVFVYRTTGKIVATGTLLIEPKLIHSGCSNGHIEDCVVDQSIRRQRLGFRLVRVLIEIGRTEGLYKVLLDCEDHNVPFYKSLGLKVNENQMELQLNTNPKL